MAQYGHQRPAKCLVDGSLQRARTRAEGCDDTRALLIVVLGKDHNFREQSGFMRCFSQMSIVDGLTNCRAIGYRTSERGSSREGAGTRFTGSEGVHATASAYSCFGRTTSRHIFFGRCNLTDCRFCSISASDPISILYSCWATGIGRTIQCKQSALPSVAALDAASVRFCHGHVAESGLLANPSRPIWCASRFIRCD